MVASDQSRVIFVTGLSGAGIKTAINLFEDSGVRCIDNLPLDLITQALEILEQEADHAPQTVVFGLKLTNSGHLEQFKALKEKLKSRCHLELLFLTADRLCIEDRYGTNRRKHPFLVQANRLRDAISLEQDLLREVEASSDHVIDTSSLSPQQLYQMIDAIFSSDLGQRKLFVNIVSFGFKHGPLRPLDLMYDVRFLKNPFFDQKLRSKTGLDQDVRDYIFKEKVAVELTQRLLDWHSWLLPKYSDEGKHLLRIGIGCTGGQHRSVAVVEELTKLLRQSSPEHISISKAHRDLDLPVAASS